MLTAVRTLILSGLLSLVPACGDSAPTLSGEPDVFVQDTVESPVDDVDEGDVEAPDTAAPEDTPQPEDALAPPPDDGPDVAVEEDTLQLPSGTKEPPPVPGPGWANAVVSSQITASIEVDGADLPNVAADPEKVLGPPEGTTAGITALGLIGDHVVVDLGEGEEAFDKDGPDIVVMEYGLAAGGFPEPYRVYVGEAGDGPFIPIGDGAGARGFELAGSGLASARYVKVESLSSHQNVTDGLGSPLYPGAEIDAIGAVYPGGVEPGGDESPDLIVTDPKTADADGNGAWIAGEALTITVTLTNQGDESFNWYPGVKLTADHAGVTVTGSEFWFYAIFAGMSLEASFEATAAADVPAGTTVTFEASVVALNCADNDIVCPQPNPITFTAEVAAP